MQDKILPKPKTLAECVDQYAIKTRKDFVKAKQTDANHILKIAPQLSKVRKFSWDSSIVKAIDDTSNIPPEEIISHLSHAAFPFDAIWLEGPSFLDKNDHRDLVFGDVKEKTEVPRIGMLILIDTKESSFKFFLVKEMINVKEETDFIRKKVDPNHNTTYFSDGTFPTSIFGEPVVVSPTNGIDLNDNRLLAKLEDQGKCTKEVNRLLQRAFGASVYVPERDRLISELYGAADFLARFFILLGSPNFVNNLEQASVEQDQDFKKLERENRTRVRLGLKMSMPVTPIKIDISKEAQATLDSGKQLKVRALLGWTDVRRSKEITSKYGKKFFRKAHERRIAAEVDRRGANGPRRNVTASQDSQPIPPEIT